ncbi:acyltransferase family protein, partial [Nocardia tengchongensis]
MTRPPEVVPGTREDSTALAVESFPTELIQPVHATRTAAPAETVESVIERAARQRPPLPSLTGARWWAAFAVFLLHALVFLPVYPFQKSEMFRNIHAWVPMQLGAAGVTFFFVLSGFIIYWSFRPGMAKSAFYRRRVLKIYPTHLLAAAAFIVVASVPLHRAIVWVPNLLLVHTYVPNWTTVGGLNVPSWSLAAEMLFYLSFPLVLPLIMKIPTHRLVLAAAVLLLGIAALHTSY